MKRFLSIAFILILALSACGGGGSSPGSNSPETTQSSKDSSVTPSPAAQSTVEPEITPNPPQGSDNGGSPPVPMKLDRESITMISIHSRATPVTVHLPGRGLTS